MKKLPLLSDHLIILVLCALFYLPFLGSAVLWDYDEGYFAAIAKEMFDKGEWIVPTFNNCELGDKPILIFWGMLVSFSIFGVSEFSVRFPSAIYGTITVILTYHIARRLFHNSAIALRSAFILATMLLFVVETRGTTCDGAMICWMTAALTFYVYGCRGFDKALVEKECVEKNSIVSPSDMLPAHLAPWFPQSWYIVVLMYACMGVATLAKGPAACIMATAVIGLFLLVKAFPCYALDGIVCLVCRNPYPAMFLKVCWKMRPLTAIATILAVAGPWFVAVGYLTDWEWTKMFFFEHNFDRTVAPTRGHTGFGLSVLYYPITSLFGTFPWSLFIVPFFIDLFRRLWRGVELKDTYLFAVCWVVFYFGFFTLVSTKLPHYVVPAYPALSILGAAYFFHWRRGEDWVPQFWTPTAIGALIIVGIGLTVTLLVISPKYFPQEDMIMVWVLGLLPVVMGMGGIFAYRRGGRKYLDVVYILFAVLFIPILFQWSAARISSHAAQRNGLFDLIIASKNDQGEMVPPILFANIRSQPSFSFYSGLPIHPIPMEFLVQCKVSMDEPTPAALFEQIRQELIKRKSKRPTYFLDKNGIGADAMDGQMFFIVDESEYHETLKPLFGDTLKIIGDPSRHFLKNHNHLILESLILNP